MAKGNGYRFINKDPVIDIVRTVFQDAVKNGEIKNTQDLAHKTGISPTTFYNWFGGKTRRPQHLTVKYALDAMGVREAYLRRDGSEIKGR